MLPDRPPSSASALQRVMELPTKGRHQARLPVELRDGSLVERDLIAASPEHLSLLSSSDKLQYLLADEIQAIYLGGRRTFREFLVQVGVAVGVTAILVVAAQVPYFLQHMRWIAVQLCTFVFAGVLIARKRTALGNWLTSWKALDP